MQHVKEAIICLTIAIVGLAVPSAFFISLALALHKAGL